MSVRTKVAPVFVCVIKLVSHSHVQLISRSPSPPLSLLALLSLGPLALCFLFHSHLPFKESVFTTSCSRIADASPNQLKEGLLIRFDGEAGMV